MFSLFSSNIWLEFLVFSPTTSCKLSSWVRSVSCLPFPTSQFKYIFLGLHGLLSSLSKLISSGCSSFTYILNNSWKDEWMNVLPLFILSHSFRLLSSNLIPPLLFLFFVSDTLAVSFLDPLQTEALFLPQYSRSVLF